MRNKIFLARLKLKGELIQAYNQGRDYVEKTAKWEGKRQEKLSDRIHDRINVELQKENGKKFVSNEEVDGLIDGILKDELYNKKQ